MAVILCAGEKGGTGKSTLATNLAVMRRLAGRDVCLLDCDPQSSSAQFIERRREGGILPAIECVQRYGKTIHQDIASLSQRYEDLIIDTGGRDSVEMRRAMIAPSISAMYIPLQASAFDLETLCKIDTRIEQARDFHAGLQGYVVLNRAPTNVKMRNVSDAVAFIREFANIALARSVIRERVSFQHAAALGQGVVEYEADRGGGKATAEMATFFAEIFGATFQERKVAA
jgi:chromosome partitioning protein